MHSFLCILGTTSHYTKSSEHFFNSFIPLVGICKFFDLVCKPKLSLNVKIENSKIYCIQDTILQRFSNCQNDLVSDLENIIRSKIFFIQNIYNFSIFLRSFFPQRQESTYSAPQIDQIDIGSSSHPHKPKNRRPCCTFFSAHIKHLDIMYEFSVTVQPIGRTSHIQLSRVNFTMIDWNKQA